jgi:hypothetical protein
MRELMQSGEFLILEDDAAVVNVAAFSSLTDIGCLASTSARVKGTSQCFTDKIFASWVPAAEDGWEHPDARGSKRVARSWNAATLCVGFPSSIEFSSNFHFARPIRRLSVP